MNRTLRLALSALPCLALAGCPAPPPAAPDGAAPDALGADAASDAPTDDAPADAGPPLLAECNPLGFPESCPTPFPSAYYLRADTASATGVRVALPAGAMPRTRGAISGERNQPLDPTPWNRIDGFSPSGYYAVYFRERIDPATLVGPADIARSMQPGAATAIVDMETHERVAHFAEVDANVTTPRDRQTVMIRPAVRLRPGHRYAIAVTRAAHALDGSAVTVPPGFQAILDGHPERDARLAAVAPRYDAIFAALAAAGIQRTELLLAWDVVTTSEAHLTAPVLAMRDTALSMLGTTGLAMTVTHVDEGYNATTLRRVQGTVRVPFFLTNNGGMGSVLNRDATGTPAVVGVRDVPFVAIIPRSVATGAPATLVQYGHGLLGSAVGEIGPASEPNRDTQQWASAQRAVLFATDWIGLSSSDGNDALLALSNFNHLEVLTSRLQQSLVNAVVLYRTARALFASNPAFMVPDGAGGMRPVLAAAPTRAYFYGVSLGGIMGGSFLGYSPDCDRGVLNVNGGNWSLLFQRATNFRQFNIPLADYPNLDDRVVLLTLAQSLFDYSDPINVAPHWLHDPLPGVPSIKHVLSQMAANDASVNNLTTAMVARAAGLPLMTPAPFTPFGLTPVTVAADSAMEIYDEHPTPAPPGTNVPAEDNPTHGHMHTLNAVLEQDRRFLREMGRVEHVCPAACSPE